MTSFSGALDVVGAVSLVIGAIAYLKSTTRKVNDGAATELIANLTALRETDKEEFNKRLKALEDQHLEDAKLLAHMQGQIATYKDVPLQELSVSMASIATDIKLNAQSSAQILETLRKSAVIAAADRNILVGAKTQNIEEQHVEHQTVNEVQR